MNSNKKCRAAANAAVFLWENLGRVIIALGIIFIFNISTAGYRVSTDEMATIKDGLYLSADKHP